MRLKLTAKDWIQLCAVLAGAALFSFFLDRLLTRRFSASLTKGSSEAEFHQALDAAMPRILRHFNVPGVVVSTVIAGAPARTYAYGWADRAHRRPMTPDTVFRVASISKSVTAWGVLRLVEQRKVALDAPVQRYLAHWPLPPSPFPSQAVTVRRLLNHSAGLNGGDDSYRAPGQPPISPLALLRGRGAGAGREPAELVAPADHDFVYSVPGYTLLQMMIEDQTHQPFADYMKSAIMRPLGMSSSSYDWDPALHARTATPYSAEGQAGTVDIPQDQAADSLFSTGPDLARFVAAPLPDRTLPAGAGVLDADTVGRLFNPTAGTPSLRFPGLGPDVPSLGCFVETLSGGQVVITNNGHDPGWLTRFYIVPSTGDGVVVLTNTDGAQAAITQIIDVWAAWRGLPPSNITIAYRTFGLEAAAILSLLVTLGVMFAGDLVLGVRSGARRFAPSNPASLTSAWIEALLALSTIGVWLAAHGILASMPTFRAVGAAVIALFGVVVAGRTLFAPAWESAGLRPVAKPAKLVAFGMGTHAAWGRIASPR